MLQTLIDYGFTQVGVIFVDEVGQVRSKITDPDFDLPLDEPSVYAWVDGQDVKYVGKASKGIRKRLGEHRGGWRGGSGTGMKNATLIRETIVASREVMKIYGRLGNHTVHITDIEFRGKFGSSHTRTFMTREEAINFVELLARGII
jgi:hypothetical protein